MMAVRADPVCLSAAAHGAGRRDRDFLQPVLGKGRDGAGKADHCCGGAGGTCHRTAAFCGSEHLSGRGAFPVYNRSAYH